MIINSLIEDFIYGKLLGEKLGNQWIIPKDTQYPDDKRIKTGNYRNWRQKQSIYRTHPKLMKSLAKMSTELYGVYGNSMCKVILYGSYARGEQEKDSDVDIALLLKDKGTDEMHENMLDIVVDYELDLAVTLSVVPIEMKQYQEWRTSLPFYKNLDKDGIILWKAD